MYGKRPESRAAVAFVKLDGSVPSSGPHRKSSRSEVTGLSVWASPVRIVAHSLPIDKPRLVGEPERAHIEAASALYLSSGQHEYRAMPALAPGTGEESSPIPGTCRIQLSSSRAARSTPRKPTKPRARSTLSIQVSGVGEEI